MNGDVTAWEARAAAKRAAALSKIPVAWRLTTKYLKGHEQSDLNVLDIPAKCGILDQNELQITQLDAQSLAKAAQTGSLKAVDIATAFCKRAAIAQQLVNCLTETFFDDAIDRAKWLDSYYAEHGKPLGPLHGVPISIKDCFNYKGVPSTLGLISYLDKPLPTENSTLVDTLLDLGAILYCKTNIPTTMMSADSHNNVFGRTLNPHKLKLGAGGSSGGEGALVAMKGSPLGVGTDIGGSIRLPALCNGTYGFKPSAKRVPDGKQAECSKAGQPGFPAVAGPLCGSFEDMALFMKAVIESQPWNRDAASQYLPWRDGVASKSPSKLRIGYWPEENAFPVHPPVRRALDIAAAALQAAGHDVILLRDMPSLKTASDLASDYWSMDNEAVWLQHIDKGGEPVIPSLQKTLYILKKRSQGYTLEDLFNVNVLSDEYKALWHKVWIQNNLDVILCPPAQTTAIPHDEYGTPHYTLVWNLLEYAACIIPVGKADKAIDTNELAKPGDARQYDSEITHGAPTSIQLVARPMQDEELISYARIIDQIVNHKQRIM